MKQFFKNATVLLLCASMAACSTMRVVADGRDAVDTVARDATQGLHAGEMLRIFMRDGREQNMVYTRTEASELVGTVDGTETRYVIASVVKIERRESDGVKTTGVILGAVALLAALVAGARHVGKELGQDIADTYSGKGKR